MITLENRITIDLCDKCNRILCCYGGKTVMIAHGFRCKYTTLTNVYEEGVYYNNGEQYIQGSKPKSTTSVQRWSLLSQQNKKNFQ